MSYRIDQVPWTHVRDELAAGRRTAALPLGCVEQHGPHLPMGADNWSIERLSEMVAERHECAVLPVMPYGPQYSFMGFPGSIAIDPELLRRFIVEIGKSLQRHGFDLFVLLVGHQTSYEPARFAARDLRELHDLRCAYFEYPGLEEAAQAAGASPAPVSGKVHADDIETSMMLASRPDLVHMEAAPYEAPDVPTYFNHIPYSWYGTLLKDGIFGDARSATPEKGQQILTAVADRVVAVLRDIERDRP